MKMFQVGDRVRRIDEANEDNRGNQIPVGYIGSVTAVEEWGDIYVDGVFWFAEYTELVESAKHTLPDLLMALELADLMDYPRRKRTGVSVWLRAQAVKALRQMVEAGR